MKAFSIFCVIFFLLNFKAARGTRCVNMWDDGCVNGQISGSGRDDEYVNGDFNPGKRCVNMWDEGCVNGQLVGSGRDNDFVNGGFNPGKRCVNMWDEGCVNGQLIGSGRDDDFVNGGFNPGKRCVGQSCNAKNLGNHQRPTKINNRLAYYFTKHFKNTHI